LSDCLKVTETSRQTRRVILSGEASITFSGLLLMYAICCLERYSFYN
jgi:hypothetical protein